MMDTGITVCKIKLGDFEKAKKFSQLVIEFESDISLISGRFVIDAKSVLGVLSLDISKELTLAVIEKTSGECEKIKKLMTEYGYTVE